MPRSKNPANYPMFFHEVALLAARKPIRIPGGTGPAGKKKAEKYRFTYYGFCSALERHRHLDEYTLAISIQVVLRYDVQGDGEKFWYLMFQNRENDPFWDDFREAVTEAGFDPKLAEPREEPIRQPIDPTKLRVDD